MKQNIELFPYVLLRIAGGRYDDFVKTDVHRALILATALHKKEEALASLKETLTDHLYTQISQAASHEERHVLIKLRRDIHNDRLVGYASEGTLSQLPAPLQKMLARYQGVQTKIARLKEEGEQIYQEETKQSKQTFAELLKQPNLQNGLLLSSDTILESLKKYLANKNEPSAVISKKERSFMEYLSRMYTKPTPFSAFTHLAIARLGKENSSSLAVPEQVKMTVKSHIRLNNELFRHLSGLLVSHTAVRQCLLIVPNFTIHKEGTEYCFLTNYRNQESFQYIAATPALEVIYAIATKKQWAYRTLIKEIIQKRHIDAPEEVVKTYIDNLLDAGFFELDLEVSGLDHAWASKLVKRISSIPERLPPLKRLVNDLTVLQKLALQYQKASAAERPSLLKQAYELAKTMCMALGATDTPANITANGVRKEAVFKHIHDTVFRLKPQQLWYEDTAYDTPLLLAPELKQSLKSFGNLLTLMGPFDTCLEKGEAMAQFFTVTYGAEAKVGFLQFYRDYSKWIDQHKKIENPVTKQRQTRQRKALESLTHNIKDQLNNDEIRLTAAHLPNLGAPHAHDSFAAFFHVYKDKETMKAVLSNTMPGYGRMFGRFLYLFPNDVTEELRSWSTGQKSDVVMAEATDASVLNVNLHSRILPYEIRTPGGHTTNTASSRIDVTELAVAYDFKDKRVVLLHPKSQKKVFVLDLGFESPLRRSKLYTLLTSFTPGPHHTVGPLVAHINKQLKNKEQKKASVVLPRITYQNHVVLQRKTWLIPKDKLPVRNSGESDWSYFLRLINWKEQLGLPYEIFVKKGFEKPQYVSLRNPLLIAVLESIINAVSDELRIEEMLPGSRQLLNVVDEKRVTELLCQWHIR